MRVLGNAPGYAAELAQGRAIRRFEPRVVPHAHRALGADELANLVGTGIPEQIDVPIAPGLEQVLRSRCHDHIEIAPAFLRREWRTGGARDAREACQNELTMAARESRHQRADRGAPALDGVIEGRDRNGADE